MSLLQDALRRAQRGSGSPGGGTPLPEPGPVPPGRRDRRGLVRGAVLILFLLAVAALYFYDTAPVERQVAVPPPGTPPVPAAAPVASSSPTASKPSPTPLAVGSPGPKPGGRVGRASPAVSKAAPVAAAADRAGPESAVRSAPPENPSRNHRAALLARYNEGIRAQQRGDWEVSARTFREIVDSDPTVIEAWNGLGLSLMRSGRLPEADAAISRARSLSPNYPAAVVNEGLLRLQEGRTAESAALFERAVSLDPANPVPRVNLAIAQGILGNTREAERTLMDARRRFPANPEILYNLGALYERIGDRERSAEAYSAFLSASAGRFPAREAEVRDRLRAWGGLP